MKTSKRNQHYLPKFYLKNFSHNGNKKQIEFLLCRSINTIDKLLERCKDTYNDDRGLIIPLVDQDIITLLQNYDNWDNTFIDEFITGRVKKITLS